MSKRMASEDKKRSPNDSFGAQAQEWFRDRIVIGPYTTFRFDAHNIVVQPETGFRDEDDRSYYGTLVTALEALCDRTLESRAKGDLKSVLAEVKNLRAEIAVLGMRGAS